MGTTGRADSARTSASVNQPIVQQIMGSIENRISQAQAVNKENNNIIAETGNFTQEIAYEDNTEFFNMDADPRSPEELEAYVQNTLSNLQNKFHTISDGILNRVDQMSVRLDSLERAIAELMTESGMDLTSETPRQ